MKNQIGYYIHHILHLTPSQIKSFGKSYIVPQDFSNLKNKKRFKVFLTKTQIKKLDKAKANKEKVDLKFSKTQFKKTLPYVTRINHSLLTQKPKDLLDTLKKEKAKKERKIKKLKLKTLKKENSKKEKKIKKLKLDKFIENTLKKYKDPKLIKKSIWDVIKFPKPLTL